MPNIRCISHTLNFTFSAGTSRGVMHDHITHFLVIEQDGRRGIGECAPLPGLSIDALPDFKEKVARMAQTIAQSPFPTNDTEITELVERIPPTLPAIRFGAEVAWRDWLYGGTRTLYPSVMYPKFAPLPINGLVWMGSHEAMRRQIDEKIDAGFTCVKLKIGALDFDEELRLLAYVREHYSPETITLRVDANGAFSPHDALSKLHQLARYDLHSIEQPIAAGQWESMASLCRDSPVPIALDEELIGSLNRQDKEKMLDVISPQYIILKPTLVGGLAAAHEWIALAEARHIGWWATSALESSIGLNAIAQWVATYSPSLPQGLGTGQLYHNNIESPIQIDRGYLVYDTYRNWDLSLFQQTS